MVRFLFSALLFFFLFFFVPRCIPPHSSFDLLLAGTTSGIIRVDGEITIQPTSTLTISLTGTVLTDLRSNGTVIIPIITTTGTTVDGEFGNIGVSTGVDCERVTTEQTDTPTGLSLVFNLDDSTCDGQLEPPGFQMWIIAVIVVPIVVVGALAVVGIYVWKKKKFTESERNRVQMTAIKGNAKSN
jgi:hypothetical protein